MYLERTYILEPKDYDACKSKTYYLITVCKLLGCSFMVFFLSQWNLYML
jgi:hypothetical protein